MTEYKGRTLKQKLKETLKIFRKPFNKNLISELGNCKNGGGNEELKMTCKSHRSEVYNSFIYDDDLKDFKPDDENSTFILEFDQNTAHLLDIYRKHI